MTRLYLRIFISFWLITTMMIVGTSLVVHWFDLGTNKPLGNNYHSGIPTPEMRLMHDVVRQAINSDVKEIRLALQSLPPWATRHLYIVDYTDHDILDRPLPMPVQNLLSGISHNHPFHKRKIHGRFAFGRYITLEDGNIVKVITLTHPDGRNIFWQLFFNAVWPTLLVSILISGTACFFVAKHMSRGLITLKKATRQIAGGDLSVRVAPKLKGRLDEIGVLGTDFDHMTERLEKAMLEQKRLIKDVSHELRSPLARLQVALALAQKRSNGDVDQELNRIKEAAEYLNGIISDILSLPLNENETWELNDTLDLRSLLETLIANYTSEAGNKGVKLAFKGCVADALVPTHGNTLIGVFDNVLRNALHYTSPNTPIDIILGNEDNRHYRVQIVDRGAGVPEQNLNDIFQPFYRLDEARDRRSGGYGLGLAIAQRTVALHNGSISASNNPEGGLTVTIILRKADLD